MKIIQGNLLTLALDGHFDVIVHGCNCHCRMGRGIALQIRELFPEAFAADKTTTPGNRAKLGTISTADIVRGNSRFTIVNAYTQFNWSGAKLLADYQAIASAFEVIKSRFKGQRIGYPRIGAGLAGGDWGVIAVIIDQALKNEDHTLVEFVDSSSAINLHRNRT